MVEENTARDNGTPEAGGGDWGVKGDEVVKVKEQLTQAVGKYRLAVLAGAPGVPEELVKGETVEEIDASLEKARGMVARIRQQVEAEAAGKKVPAGAPPRSNPDLSALSPREKIAFALSKR